jgi:hypothetical protein
MQFSKKGLTFFIIPILKTKHPIWAGRISVKVEIIKVT